MYSRFCRQLAQQFHDTCGCALNCRAGIVSVNIRHQLRQPLACRRRARDNALVQRLRHGSRHTRASRRW
jgi:hypothetical protein